MLSSSIEKKTQKDFLVLIFLIGSFPVQIVFLVFAFLFHLLVYEKPKTPKLFRCVSLNFFSFYWVIPRRRPWWKCRVALICTIVDLTKSPYYFVFSCWIKCLQIPAWSMTLLHYYYFHIVRPCKWKAIMTIFDELAMAERNGYELNLFCFSKYG